MSFGPEVRHYLSDCGIGSKKAKTKERLLNESVSTAVIDEKFQINTNFDVELGGQIKPKLVIYLADIHSLNLQS